MRILKDWTSFFIFLRSPHCNTIEYSTKDKIWFSINLFILKTILILGIGFLIAFLSDKKVPNQVATPTVLYSVYGVVIFAGIFEEFVFRLFLTYYNNIYISIFFSGTLFIAIKKIFFHNMILDREGIFISAGIALLSLPLLYYIIQKNEVALDRFWKKHFPYVFYFSAIIFTLAHFFNNIEFHLSFLKFNITHLISALVLGFVRIRAGLIFAIALHIIWDLLII